MIEYLHAFNAFIQNKDVNELYKRDIDDDETDPAVEELYSSRALFILVALLICTLWVSYYLQLRKIKSVHETVVSIFAGMAVGLIIRVTPGRIIQEMVSFQYTYFFNLLLPPIILNSGYELHQANFFRNIVTILTFALFGTFISAIVIGLLVFLWAKMGFEGLHVSFVAAMSVGATLSATDPVTILSVFNTYKVDPKLYSIIFGESLLNDAVSIVMFETLQKFEGESIHFASVMKGVGIFFVLFVVSVLIGVLVGFMTALMLKHSLIMRYPQLESCLIILIAYACYLFSNSCQMSGIVSLLFCAITMKHYAYFNMSRRTQLTTKYLFQVLAQLSENFIFIYLGISLFTQTDLVYKPVFIIITSLAICIGRYAAVFPMSSLLNFIYRHRSRGQSEELSNSYQVMLFWAGLRGAVGVALAAGLEGDQAAVLKSTILVVVVLTVIVFGGTSARMLEILGIRINVQEDEESDDDEAYDIENRRFYTNGRGGPDTTAHDEMFRLGSSGNGSPKFQSDYNNDRAAIRRARNNSNGGSPTFQPPSRPTSAQSTGHNRSYTGDSRNSRNDSDNDSTGSDLPPMPGTSQQTIPPPPAPRDAPKGTLSSLISSTAEDHARWFAQFDENVLKPVLLHDSSKGGPKHH